MSGDETSQSSFTGRERRRTTTWRVKAADRAARFFITLGGLGTIFAVSLVCFFLVWVVIPLFVAPEIEALPSVSGGAKFPPLRTTADEYRVLAWSLDAAGDLRVRRVDTGEVLEDRALFGDGPKPTAWSFPPSGGAVACGFDDGTCRFGVIRFATSFLEGDEPEALRTLKPGDRAIHDGGVVERTVEGQLRLQKLSAEFDAPFDLGGGKVDRLDRLQRSQGPMLVVLGEDDVLRVKEVRQTKNLMTGKVKTTLTGGEVPLPAPEGAGTAVAVRLLGVGTSAIVIREDGRFARLDTRDIDALAVAEEGDLLADPGLKVTAVAQLVGKSTVVIGDSAGGIHTWFAVKPDDARTPDGVVMVNPVNLPGHGSAVSAIAPSSLTRTIAVGYDDGAVRLFHVTSHRLLGEGRTSDGARILSLAITPKDDGVLAETSGGLSRWDIHAPHPETTAAALFLPVWYEGAPKAEHTWQSSSGTDDFEPKFGMWPLVFGTLKATIYSMLFSVPIALLAAIYTSEFMDSKLRSRVKPAIELMASLPSVVLGFLAALVFAPVVEKFVPATLAAFVTVPFSLLVGAHLWQMLPRDTAARLARYRLAAFFVALPVGLLAAFALGGAAESLFFSGDIKSWLDGQVGTATGGWMIAMLPLVAVGVALAVTRWINPRLEEKQAHASRAVLARTGLLKFALGSAVAFLLAWALSGALSATGADPRDLFLGTYIQRNALVVGFVMGFAVIPIIYTLAEDALAAVPEHLRAASLAVGATKWQTAIQVIVPTAVSGLFSACMIGLGRAVGETMVVLMAAGNTPVMDLNVFNGFRTLSANIAVELPEAVQHSTTYRLLFLSALVLFAITFVLNTVAELVRQRFRKRAFQL